MENLQQEQTSTEIISDGIENQDTTQKLDNESSDSFGRFKTSDELVKAYSSLEKEFTKRSQRLKALEREIEETNTLASTTEYSKEDWAEKVDNFLNENPVALPFKKDLSKVILEDNLANNPNCLELALNKVLVNNYRTPASLIDDAEFLDKYIYCNESVCDKIIKDYLCKVSSVHSPKTIGGSGQPVLTPPTRPKSFGEAGKMAIMLSEKGSK